MKHLFYTSIQRSTDFVLAEVTESDLATEAYLQASGLVYTILRNGYYFEGLGYLIGREVPSTELRFPAGEGKIAFVKRTDLAAATAALLTGEERENHAPHPSQAGQRPATSQHGAQPRAIDTNLNSL